MNYSDHVFVVQLSPSIATLRQLKRIFPMSIAMSMAMSIIDIDIGHVDMKRPALGWRELLENFVLRGILLFCPNRGAYSGEGGDFFRTRMEHWDVRLTSG